MPTSLPLPAGRQPAELSSVAVDALQLAQYLKNAIAAIFDVTRLTARSEHDTSLLSSLVANISTVSSHTDAEAGQLMILCCVARARASADFTQIAARCRQCRSAALHVYDP